MPGLEPLYASSTAASRRRTRGIALASLAVGTSLVAAVPLLIRAARR